MAKKLKWNLILMSLLYLALGIFLLMVPGTALNVVCCGWAAWCWPARQCSWCGILS